jgi:hypothetical protein
MFTYHCGVENEPEGKHRSDTVEGFQQWLLTHGSMLQRLGIFSPTWVVHLRPLVKLPFAQLGQLQNLTCHHCMLEGCPSDVLVDDETRSSDSSSSGGSINSGESFHNLTSLTALEDEGVELRGGAHFRHVSALTGLRTLTLDKVSSSEGPLSDMSPLLELPQLTALKFVGGPADPAPLAAAAITGVAQMTKLQHLCLRTVEELSGQQLAPLAALTGSTELRCRCYTALGHHSIDINLRSTVSLRRAVQLQQ